MTEVSPVFTELAFSFEAFKRAQASHAFIVLPDKVK